MQTLARWGGLILHVPMLFLFIVQGLVMPTEGVLLLVGAWVALLVAIVVLWRRAPIFIALVPIIDVGVLYGVTAIGRALFDWRAGGPP
jgi:hypothetical protein